MREIIQNKILYPEILWERPVHFFKPGGGKILILGGSSGATQAAAITCEAVFRSGTGALTLGFPDKLKDFYKEILTEAMSLPLPSTPSVSIAKRAEPVIIEQAKSCNVAIIGPGLSSNAETIHLVWELIFKLEIPIILSDDGLKAFIKGVEVMRSKKEEGFLIEYFKKKRGPLIIVASSSEAIKIMNTARFAEQQKATKVENNYKKVASLLSQKLCAYTIIKDKDIITAEPQGNIVNTPTTLASTIELENDILAGILGSFIGQNPDKPLQAISTASYLYAKTLKTTQEKVSDRPIVASDMIRYLKMTISQEGG